MWEGHRIIYPNLRKIYQESKEVPFPHPYLDEQKLEYLESFLQQAITSSSFVRITIWHQNGSQEKEIAPLQQQGNYLKCRNTLGAFENIPLANIIDVES